MKLFLKISFTTALWLFVGSYTWLITNIFNANIDWNVSYWFCEYALYIIAFSLSIVFSFVLTIVYYKHIDDYFAIKFNKNLIDKIYGNKK